MKKLAVSLIVKIIFAALIVALLIFTAVKLMPWFLSLKNTDSFDSFRNYVTSRGTLGFLIILGIQFLQIIVAILPGEPIEVLSGAMYGPFGGLALCLLGIMLGTLTIYFAVKFFGRELVAKLFGNEKIKSVSFLNDPEKLEIIFFILFLIPGTPKDILTYIAPLTPVKPLPYFLIVIFARIPSIITSTYAGASISNGNFITAIIVFAVTGIIGILGIVFNKRIVEYIKKVRSKN